MQPVARTRVVGASFVLLFATEGGVYLHVFLCQNIPQNDCVNLLQ